MADHPAPPTIHDLARLADVSIGTVSKALNGGGRLRQETRERVERVAREIGYRPNDLAHSLRRARSRTIGILTSDSFGRFSMPIVEALEERLAEAGIAVFMCNATDDPERERHHLDQLQRKRIDGLVVTARRADMRAPLGPLAHATPGGLRLSPRSPTRARSASSPTTPPAPSSPSSISPPSAAAASPTSPAPSTSTPSACAARAGAPRSTPRACRNAPASTSPASGRRLGAARPPPAFSPPPTPPTPSSAATTRSPAASPTRCASAACASPTTWRWSASTTGT